MDAYFALKKAFYTLEMKQAKDIFVMIIVKVAYLSFLIGSQNIYVHKDLYIQRLLFGIDSI